MEIEDIRKELNHLLNSIVDHSTKFSDERPIPSLEISFVLTKINKMQENLSVLRHLLKEKELAVKLNKAQLAEKPKTKEEDSPIKTREELKSPENPPVGESLEKPSISNLADALTLNDRYLYANELFDKDMNAFNEIIKSIDASTSFNDAKGLLSSLGWDNENEHVQSFIELVERRFS